MERNRKWHQQPVATSQKNRRRVISLLSVVGLLIGVLIIDMVAFPPPSAGVSNGDTASQAVQGSSGSAEGIDERSPVAESTDSDVYTRLAPRDGGALPDTSTDDGSTGDPREMLRQLEQSTPHEGTSSAVVHAAATVPDEARELLRAYRLQHNCVLAQAGYIDLFGEVWGCVVQGEGWVDIGVVKARGQSDCELQITRLFVDAWQEEARHADKSAG